MLVEFDKDIFDRESNRHPHNDLLADNPYSSFVDFSRYSTRTEIPQDVKQLLYRPERMSKLKAAFDRITDELSNDY